MFAELSLRIESDQKIGFWHASLFQGVLLEHARDRVYVAELHNPMLHPYSQTVISDREKVTWKIRTLNDEAYESLIEPWLSNELKSFELKKKEIKVEIVEKNLVTQDNRKMLDTFYSDHTDRSVRVVFESPTAFKSDSRYVFLPDVKLILGSLMRKYCLASSDESGFDQETLDYLSDHTYISAYKIRSTKFPVEGVNIPSFVGDITLKFTGTDTMARYAKMLLEYGEYSGVGIKCGVGMGAIRILKGGNDGRTND